MSREVDDDMSTLTHFSTTLAKRRDEDDVFFKDWFIALVGGYLWLDDLGRWDVAMCSRRGKWLEGLSNVKIAMIDEYHHCYNESVRWLISRRIQQVTKIKVDIWYGRKQISSRTFSGARALVNLKSIIIKKCNTDSIMDSIKVNCPNLEEVHIEYDTDGDMTCFIAAAARMVQKLPRLRCFTFTADYCYEPSIIEQSSTPLLLALAQYCPLLESLNLVRYDDAGLAELVAGCPKLHTLTINADMRGVSLAGFRALGRSRSITNLTVHTYVLDKVAHALRAMADEFMPIKTLELYTNRHFDDLAFYEDELVASVVRFAQTLENLRLRNLSYVQDESLAVLSQCHNLRSIEIENAEAGFEDDDGYGSVSGAFLIPMSVGCPLLEKVNVSEIIRFVSDEAEPEPVEVINFTPFFERCPNLKHFNFVIRTDEEVKALAQHCPLIERVLLGSRDGTIPQELSEIGDDSLVAIARGLHFVKHISLYDTQCTDAGLRALAKGECRRVLDEFRVRNGSWKEGYPQLITKKGMEELDAVLDMR